MLIGAGQPPPQELSVLQPSPQTSHSNPIIHNITQSTSNMTQYAAQLTAQLTAQQQQVPGVTYTLNPTAKAFSPGSTEEGDGKSEE